MKIFENLDINDLCGEMWKNILDYDGDYQVSNLGRVKSFKHDKIDGKILKQCKSKKGYFIVSLCKYGKHEIKSIHILIYETFNNYKLKSDECIHHIDECKENNNYENFKKMIKLDHWSLHSKKEKNPFFNKIHSEKTKKLMSDNHANFKGENHPNHKLTTKKVIQIKMLFKLNFNNKEIAKLYNVNRKTIFDIRKEKNWNHIKI